MKKLIVLLLSLMLLLGAAACGEADTVQTVTPPAENTEQAPALAPDPVPDPDPDPVLESDPAPAEESTQDGGNVLVVYFSATSNTGRVAEIIADTLDADLFELVPVDEYTSDDLNYNNDASRVSQEHEDPSLQHVELTASTVENWDEYDIVFIGYPIWWHAAAWPVNGFITGNDFTGKTVVPFCTSGSSGIEDSGTKLRDMAGTGTWLEGERFSSSVSQSDIERWIGTLGLSGTAGVQGTADQMPSNP